MKKYCLFLVFALIFVVSSVFIPKIAFAAPDLWTSYGSITDLKNGHSDFSNARFFRLLLGVEQDDGTTVTEQYMQASGDLTISGGNYSYVTNSVLQKISNTSKTFRLVPDKNMKLNGNYISYRSVTDDGKDLALLPEADGGLQNVKVSWNLSPPSSLNGEATIPNFRTTEEQLKTFVPYIELVSSDSMITGINWRVVSLDNPGTPISHDNFGMSLRITSVIMRGDFYGSDNNNYLKSDWVAMPNSTDIPAGTISFDTPVPESDFWGIRISMYTWEELNKLYLYDWYFMNFRNEPSTLWVNHSNKADLINGKSDYSKAKFSKIYISARDLNDRLAEARYFTDKGTMTIPGGGYSLEDYDTDKVLENVALGTDRVFSLRMDDEVDFADNYVEYMPADDNGRHLVFVGDNVEKNLSGKTITWTFPAELSMDGSAVVPTLKTTAEQLMTAVPYIEVVSVDNKITTINYKIVTSNDTSTVVKTLGYTTDFRIYIQHENAVVYRSSWLTNKTDGTWTLGTPQDLSDIKYIYVRLRHNDSSTGTRVCQWYFYPASSSSSEEEKKDETEEDKKEGLPSSSGSGCEIGFGLFGLAIFGSALILKRSKIR